MYHVSLRVPTSFNNLKLRCPKAVLQGYHHDRSLLTLHIDAEARIIPDRAYACQAECTIVCEAVLPNHIFIHQISGTLNPGVSARLPDLERRDQSP